MAKELTPQVAGLMNDPYGKVFEGAPGFVRTLARALLPNPQVPYAFGVAKSPFTKEAVKIANATSRNTAAIGEKALVPRIIENVATPEMSILDFGAGKTALHTSRLRNKGFNVTAHEFGENTVPGVHDPAALSRMYDIVFASNVVNVQSNPSMLQATLTQIYNSVKPGGKAIINLPLEPRKFAGLDSEMLEKMLHKVGFNSVERLGGTAQAPIFSAARK